jgi:serine/threonine protein kinase
VTHQVQLIFDVFEYSDSMDLGFDISSETRTFLNKRCTKRRVSPLPACLPSDIDKEALALISSLLVLDPRNRLDARQALQSKYLDDCEELYEYGEEEVEVTTSSHRDVRTTAVVDKYVKHPPTKYFEFENAKCATEMLALLIHDEVSFGGQMGPPDYYGSIDYNMFSTDEIAASEREVQEQHDLEMAIAATHAGKNTTTTAQKPAHREPDERRTSAPEASTAKETRSDWNKLMGWIDNLGSEQDGVGENKSEQKRLSAPSSAAMEGAALDALASDDNILRALTKIALGDEQTGLVLTPSSRRKEAETVQAGAAESRTQQQQQQKPVAPSRPRANPFNRTLLGQRPAEAAIANSGARARARLAAQQQRREQILNEVVKDAASTTASSNNIATRNNTITNMLLSMASKDEAKASSKKEDTNQTRAANPFARKPLPQGKLQPGNVLHQRNSMTGLASMPVLKSSSNKEARPSYLKPAEGRSVSSTSTATLESTSARDGNVAGAAAGGGGTGSGYHRPVSSLFSRNRELEAASQPRNNQVEGKPQPQRRLSATSDTAAPTLPVIRNYSR